MISQGDPPSPYPFIFVAGMLSVSISKAVKRGPLKGIRSGRASPMLSHLFVADDSLLYLFSTEATNQNAAAVKKILEDYCQATGQGGQHGEVFTRAQ